MDLLERRDRLVGGGVDRRPLGDVAQNAQDSDALGLETDAGSLPYPVPAVWTSPNGLTWTAADAIDPAPFEYGELHDVAVSGSGLMAVGQVWDADMRSRPAIWTSPDGGSWTLQPGDPLGLTLEGEDQMFMNVAAGPGGFVAAGMTLEDIAIAEGLTRDSAHKLVDGLTRGLVADIDFGIENGSLSAGQVAEKLEIIRSRADNPLRWSRAEVEQSGANFLALSPNSGVVMTPGFFALWIAVTLYTASFIAEVVRGGILAISKGQNEAAGALGLTRTQALRFVVLPQAFRIIFPPLGNQYLNLFKNTSLGIAVAFPDIVQIGQTTYNQNGQSIPVIFIWMGFYLAGSLIISAIVNFYNRRLKLVER